ncbi:MAG TPA: hypothetical protein VGM20_09060 [Gemmatimonadales bacterium]
MKSRNPRADAQAIVDAVDDAVIAYLARPSAARATTGREVFAHLQLAAWRNLKNLERAERRRARREAVFAQDTLTRNRASERRVVELCGAAGKVERDNSSINPGSIYRDTRHLELSEMDRAIAAMIARGIRNTTMFAAVLGILSLGIGEQRRAVKRAKDRVKAIFKRADISIRCAVTDDSSTVSIEPYLPDP